MFGAPFCRVDVQSPPDADRKSIVTPEVPKPIAPGSPAGTCRKAKVEGPCSFHSYPVVLTIPQALPQISKLLQKLKLKPTPPTSSSAGTLM